MTVNDAVGYWVVQAAAGIVAAIIVMVMKPAMPAEALNGSLDVVPALLAEELETRARTNRLPKAVILVHLYGQSADIAPVQAACDRYGVTLIEDAAEALGSTYQGRKPGVFGKLGIYSFNGNKIITTSGGGMLVSDDAALVTHARKLATQARDQAPHYQHSEIGYNYRMSNILAAIGRGQLEVLEERVQARRRNFDYYTERLGRMAGIDFMPEAPWGRHARWLTCITVDPAHFGADREAIRCLLEAENIEARPVWKPLHLQPIFAECESVCGEVAADLFARGLCLPSGSSLTVPELDRICTLVETLHRPR